MPLIDVRNMPTLWAGIIDSPSALPLTLMTSMFLRWLLRKACRAMEKGPLAPMFSRRSATR